MLQHSSRQNDCICTQARFKFSWLPPQNQQRQFKTGNIVVGVSQCSVKIDAKTKLVTIQHFTESDIHSPWSSTAHAHASDWCEQFFIMHAYIVGPHRLYFISNCNPCTIVTGNTKQTSRFVAYRSSNSLWPRPTMCSSEVSLRERTDDWQWTCTCRRCCPVNDNKSFRIEVRLPIILLVPRIARLPRNRLATSAAQSEMRG